jgi:hypothetical protein
MIQLAYIQLLDSSGQDMTVRCLDIASVTEDAGGAILHLSSGQQLKTNSTVTQVTALLDGKWTEYVTRGGSTAAYTPSNVTTDRAFDAEDFDRRPPSIGNS